LPASFLTGNAPPFLAEDPFFPASPFSSLLTLRFLPTPVSSFWGARVTRARGFPSSASLADRSEWAQSTDCAFAGLPKHFFALPPHAFFSGSFTALRSRLRFFFPAQRLSSPLDSQDCCRRRSVAILAFSPPRDAFQVSPQNGYMSHFYLRQSSPVRRILGTSIRDLLSLPSARSLCGRCSPGLLIYDASLLRISRRDVFGVRATRRARYILALH